MNSEADSQPHKYHLSVNNLTNKQPSIVKRSSICVFMFIVKSILFFFQYKTLDISKDLIVYGTEKNTGALFIYRRHPYTFFKAVPGNIIRGEYEMFLNLVISRVLMILIAFFKVQSR